MRAVSKRTRKQTAVAEATVGAQCIASEVTIDDDPVTGTDNQELDRKTTVPARRGVMNQAPTPGKHPYLQKVVEDTSDAMIALDEHFRILDLNAAMTSALDCSPEEAIGRNCSAILRCRNLN